MREGLEGHPLHRHWTLRTERKRFKHSLRLAKCCPIPSLRTEKTIQKVWMPHGHIPQTNHRGYTLQERVQNISLFSKAQFTHTKSRIPITVVTPQFILEWGLDACTGFCIFPLSTNGRTGESRFVRMCFIPILA